MLQLLLPLLANIGGQVAKNLFPDPADETKRKEAENQFTLGVMQHATAIEQAAADIVKTEAQSSHWLTANWRPITALVFVGLVVARWLGWTAPGMTEPEYLAVYDIIQVMIGGYVVSRGVEKVLPSIAEMMKKK